MTDLQSAYFNSEIGWIKITASENGIRKLEFEESGIPNKIIANPYLKECLKELDEYFEGKRKNFTVKLDWEGTKFQQRVWNYLLTIPFGKTTSYMNIAKALGDEKSVRAVGTANGQNNIAIIIPCHGVIGSNGTLTGYAGGIWRKDWLLKHENEYSSADKQLEIF